MIKIHSANKSIESKVLFKNIDFELENKKLPDFLVLMEQEKQVFSEQ